MEQKRNKQTSVSLFSYICHWHDTICIYVTNDFSMVQPLSCTLKWWFLHVWCICNCLLLLSCIPLSSSSSSWFPSFFHYLLSFIAQFFCLFAIEHPCNLCVCVCLFNLNSDKNDIIIVFLCWQRAKKIDGFKCHTPEGRNNRQREKSWNRSKTTIKSLVKSNREKESEKESKRHSKWLCYYWVKNCHIFYDAKNMKWTNEMKKNDKSKKNKRLHTHTNTNEWMMNQV